MAYQATSLPQSFIATLHAGMSQVWQVIASIGNSMSKGAVARQRFETLQFLQGKSDAELAALGLTRDEIVHHVFKDLYYI